MTTTTTTGLSVTVSPIHLAAALQSVTRAISTRTTLPILLNVLMEVGVGSITLTATNLEISIRKEIPAEGNEPFAITVPAKLLADFVGSLPDEPLTIEAGGRSADAIALRCGRFDTNIRGMAADEFPPGPQAEGGDRLTIPLADLLRAVEQTEFAASTDEARPVLTGELLAIEGTNLVLVATDGHRLAEWRTTLAAHGDIGIDESLTSQGARLIVPARALAELPRAFKGMDETATVDVIVSAARNQVFFRCGSSEVASRLIDGQYPSYSQIIPAAASTVLRIDKADLLGALRSVAVFAKDSAHVVKLTLADMLSITDDPKQPSNGTVTLQTATSEVGDSRVDLDAFVVAGAGDLTIAINVRYLTDAVAAVDGDEIEIRLAGPISPAVVAGSGEGYRCVVMPVRVASS